MTVPPSRHAHGPTKLFELVSLLAAVAIDLVMWQGESELPNGGSLPGWVIPVGSVASLATLLLRHRFPASVLIVQISWSTAAGIVFSSYTPLIGMLVALYVVARREPSRRSLLWSAVCALPSALFAGRQLGGVTAEATALVLYLLMIGTGWLLGYRTWLSDQRAAERDAAERAIRAERLRIARELHDIVSHAVSVMMIQSAGARAVLTADPQRAETALDVVQDVGRQSVNELRRLLGILRSASADGDGTSIEQQPGLGDLETLLANARGAGMTVTMDVRGVPGSLDPSVALTAYRLVQESLTNALKHAGAAAPVHIELAWTRQELAISVRNDAPRASGPSPLSTGLGLIGLRERVQAVGGTLETGPTPAGFSVAGVLPVAVRPALAPEPERIVG